MTVLVVSGSRDGHSLVAQVLDRWVAKHGAPDVVVLGDALGVDTGARTWCHMRGYPFELCRADWHAHGKAAGPRRNAAMVDFAKGSAWSHGTTAHLVALPVGESSGTRDCMRQALAAGLTVFEVDATGRPRQL